jgi:hypothetical protein
MTGWDEAPRSPVVGAENEDIAVYHEGVVGAFELIEDASVRRVAAYWDDLRGDRWAPRRAEVDPLDLPWALPHIFLGDCDPADGSFRYRVAGSEIEEVFAEYTDRNSLRGAALTDILPPDQAALVMRRWAPLVERGMVVYMRGWIYFAAGRAAVGERLLLPLSDDGATTTGFLGYTQCRWSAVSALSGGPTLDVWRLDTGRPARP